MSRYELVARNGTPEENDSKYTIEVVQDRLKRKKFKRMSIGCICVVVFFIISAGIAVGVTMSVLSSHDKHRDTESQSSTTFITSTAMINSLTISVLQTTSPSSSSSSSSVRRPKTIISHTSISLGEITPTTKTSTDDHSNSAKPHSSVGIPTIGAAVSLLATTKMATVTFTDKDKSMLATAKTLTSSRHTVKSTSIKKHFIFTSSTKYQMHSTASHTSLTTTSPSPTIIPPNIINSQVLNYIDTYYDPCEYFY